MQPLLQAGHELDALVAERVMGWRHVKVTAGYSEVGSSEILYDHHDYWERPDLSKTHLHHFSTDIAAAWQVVEKLGSWHGFKFILCLRDKLNAIEVKLEEGRWEAGWFEDSYEGPEARVVSYGDTAPEAICRAALETVGA